MADKPLKYLVTSQVQSSLNEVALKLLFVIGRHFRAYPFDMFVLEPRQKQTNIRLAGYHFYTGELNETQIIDTIPMELPEPLWFKIDNYGTQFVGTLLYPHEY